MKIHGVKLEGPKPVEVYLPRDPSPVLFVCKAVLDYEAFEEICPEPKIRYVQRPGQSNVPNLEDKGYQKDLDKYASRRTDWMILKSLEDSPGLEWETVEMTNPDTWENYREELNDTFTFAEMAEIIKGVTEANSVSQERMKEAHELFIRLQGERTET